MNQTPASFDRYFRVSIRYRRIFFKLTKSVEATIFLSQAWFWWERSDQPNGEFWKTRRQWEKETGLTRRQQDAARKVLLHLEFITEPTVDRGKPRRFTVGVTTVLEAIKKYSEGSGDVCKKEFPEIDAKDTKVSEFQARKARKKQVRFSPTLPAG